MTHNLRWWIIGACAGAAVLAVVAVAWVSNSGDDLSTEESEASGTIEDVSDQATIHTNHGDIKVTLFPNEAPKTVRNFVNLATGEQEWKHPRTGQPSNDPLYDGTIFHRIIPDFMIQGGDPLGRGTGGPGYQFEDEFHPERTFDQPYLLAMANSGPNTNGSQFFITTVPTPWLNFKHTVFGAVTDAGSRAVVDEIQAVPTKGQDKPKQDVRITSVTVDKD